MNKKLKEKIAESLSAVLPITVIVVALCITVTPMPLAPLTLFLADSSRGDLTEEQRAFAKEKKAEVHSSFSLSVYELILYQVMHSLHLVSGPEDFAAAFSNPKGNETGRRLPPCNGL